MVESVPGSHFTLVRKPQATILASQGLPYLDKVVFRIARSRRRLRGICKANAVDSTDGRVAGCDTPAELQKPARLFTSQSTYECLL